MEEYNRELMNNIQKKRHFQGLLKNLNVPQQTTLIYQRTDQFVEQPAYGDIVAVKNKTHQNQTTSQLIIPIVEKGTKTVCVN